METDTSEKAFQNNIIGNMGKIKLEGYVCERCGHKWVPRETTTEEPKVCPKCKSPYWNAARKDNKSKSTGN